MDENTDKKPKYTYEELSDKYIEKKDDKNAKKREVKQFASDYQMIVSFGVTLVVLIALGIFLGYKLDQELQTTPLFILVFTFLGIAAAYRNLFKDANRKDKGSSKNE